MADNNATTTRPTHSRSTSITKSSRTTHQRKPSLTASSHHLYAIPEKSIPPSVSTSSTPIPPLDSYPASPKRMSRPAPQVSQWQRYASRIASMFESLFASSGPLLPHDKPGAAFGDTHKRSKLAFLGRSRLVRFLTLFYVVFSVFLSFNHLWHWAWTSTPALDPRFGDTWKPRRTYDPG